jgi:signal transduction histidine kinase
MSIFDEISEENRELLEKNKLDSMDEMMQNIAHQWRQPLSQINSVVSLIDDILYEKNIKDPLLEEKLQEIESLTKYMSNTINDFQGYFEQTNIKSLFSLSESLKKSIELINVNLSENIKITTKIENNVKCNGYASEFEQVLLVLLNNAKDALLNRNIHQAKIEIEILQDTSSVVIQVRDNAGGMTKSVMQKIFEPYFTTKHKSQGTGLGLYMSRKIIEDRFNGKLNVKNLNNGTCFEITLSTYL